jgi:hypothetical protein
MSSNTINANPRTLASCLTTSLLTAILEAGAYEPNRCSPAGYEIDFGDEVAPPGVQKYVIFIWRREGRVLIVKKGERHARTRIFGRRASYEPQQEGRGQQ